MSNPLKSRVAVVALVLVALGLIIVRLGKWPGGRAIMARARPAVAPLPEETFQVRPRLEVMKEQETWEDLFQAANPLRDPFAWPHSTNEGPAHALPATVPSFVLQAISIDADRAVAVLNRRLLGVGESIGQYTVERILPTEVWMRGPTGQLVVRLAR